MKLIRENRLLKYFWFIMACIILNSSIDVPDIYEQFVPEDLTYNDIETIVELVLEDVLGIENAICEQDDVDADDGYNFSTKKVIDIYIFIELKQLFLITANNNNNNESFGYIESFIIPFYPDILPPPPWA